MAVAVDPHVVDVRLDEVEHSDHEWVSYGTALARVNYRGLRDGIRSVNAGSNWRRRLPPDVEPDAGIREGRGRSGTGGGSLRSMGMVSGPFGWMGAAEPSSSSHCVDRNIGNGAGNGSRLPPPLVETYVRAMRGMLNFVGMTAGGWVGWQLGALVSFFTAFMIGMVGTGLGLYAAQRATRRWLP